MEVVLLEDVKALGKKGQIVKVNEGYARNFILPKKLGVEATPKNLNDLKLQKANAEKMAAQQDVYKRQGIMCSMLHWIKTHKYALVGLYLFVFLAGFGLLELVVKEPKVIIHCPVDDLSLIHI